ncbi:hypothetical protein DEO72_LG4g830 [Vigna unguiculata]|uniref:Uncharacterized protein n=1 Tax=Vigna unguiculata TaxID=3917 RepID=A0A4D6LN35_VIGUN|nr:hypothetical protein DEO72_LG4g830 [Vigna unguiculata]
MAFHFVFFAPPSSSIITLPKNSMISPSSHLVEMQPSSEMQPPLLQSVFAPASATTELRLVVFSVHPAATTMTAPRSRVYISSKQPRITSSPRTSAHQYLPQPQ